MKFLLARKRALNFEYQRNLLLGISAAVMAGNLLLSFCLLFRSEKTIILPPEVRTEFWAEGNRFAPEYLEEQAAYMTHLALDVNASNIKRNTNILLRYVEHDKHAHFREKFEKQFRKLKQNNVTTSWNISEFTVFPDLNAVRVRGSLDRFMGSKQMSTLSRTYEVQFGVRRGRLFLTDIKLQGAEGEEDEKKD
jgi:conjugal transfer pilus assembly protein TraE